MSVTAVLSNISRCSIHDGPGVRTVVYFKGCRLRCRWCHNPETLSFHKDILYAPNKCIHCGRCTEICPQHHVVVGNDMLFLRDGCVHCGKCAEACPSGALSASAREYTLDEVYHQISKDRHFYRATGGGVTLSGGECLLQADFAAELLKRCRENEISTAIESALFVPQGNVEKVIPYCDLFLTDFKIPDSDKHRKYTGQGNERILSNLHILCLKAKGKILLRIPLIPNVNDSLQDMDAFAEKIRPFKDGLKGIELLKYNPLAAGKYEMAGLPYESFAAQAQSDEYVDQLARRLSHMTDGVSVYF